MHTNANPIPRLGERNLYCPFYAACLYYAAKNLWQSLDCSQCPNKSIQQKITVYECSGDNVGLYHNLSPEITRTIEECFLDWD
ncbi:MAG: hypothetical protein SVY10_02130 [Thermodesulfobacteriota bacterium]|nr:hypothetical protein [Thermodesulfobacteriota bacterium]